MNIISYYSLVSDMFDDKSIEWKRIHLEMASSYFRTLQK